MTRKKLLHYLWYEKDMVNVNLWKEGIYWILKYRNTIFQTYICRLDNLSLTDWYNFIDNKISEIA